MAIPSGGLINKYDLLDPACYPGSGTVINDLVGTSDLLVTGSPTYDANFGCLTFNGLGIGAYSLPGAMANITSTFTFSFWFRLNDGSVTQCLINNGERTSAWSGYSLFKDAANAKLDFGANFVWGGYWSSPNLDPALWYNATYTYQNVAGGTLKFYINGVLISNNTGVGGPANAYGPNAYLALGGNATAGFGAPQFQNKTSYGVVLFYNTVLTGPEVLDIYDTYVERFNPPTVAYDFSDPACYPGTGSSFFDLNGSTDGVINGTTFVSDGSASYFTTNGSSTYLSTNSYTPSSSTVFSYHIWCQLNNNTFGSLLKLGGDGSTFNTPAINVNDPTAGRLLVSFGFLVSMNNPTETIPTNTWTLVSVVCDGTTNKVYYDGVLVNSISQSTGFFGNGSMKFGRFETGQYSSAKFALFNLYNYALSDSNVTTFYNDTVARFFPPPPPPYPGLVGGRTFGQGFAG